MIGITGYKNAQATSFNELPKLEPGGYVLKILDVKVEENQWGTKIALMFDIAEGKEKDFFRKLYNATPDEWDNKKWKGSYRLKIPVNEGDEKKFNKSLGFFKSQIEAFEKSNPGLKINCEAEWNEQDLKGKVVGALFNEKEWEMNGKTGFFTNCCKLIPADDIRSGNFKIPKKTLLPNHTEDANTNGFNPEERLSDFVEVPTDDGAVPF